MNFMRVFYVNCLQFFRHILIQSGELFPENEFGNRLRGNLRRRYMKSCGKNFQVSLRVNTLGLKHISVGDDVYLGYGAWLHGVGEEGGITLDDQVMFGPYVTMVAGEHGCKGGSYRFEKGLRGHIHIERGVWLAAKATVVSGVTVGAGALIAAGAVVTKNVPSGSLAGGVPAKILKNR